MLGNTYREVYKNLVSKLGSDLEAREIILFATKKEQLPVMGELELSENELAEIELLLKRRLEGEPLQYLIGEWEFYGIPVKVGRGVLIPRPDTETLVDVALELLGGKSSPEVLDLCSGSGAISLAIAENHADAVVTAVELSDDAFIYLEENIRLNCSRIRAVKADILMYEHEKEIDLIVSNPPYIKSLDMESLQLEVKKEPTMALDGGEDGMYFYSRIPLLYYDQLKTGGYIAFEIGIDQHDEVSDILLKAGFKNIKTRKDLSGIIRVVYAEK